MKALEYRKSIPRYALLRYAGRRFPSLYASRLAPVQIRDIAPQPFPSADWVRIAPKLTGICGSDLATLCCRSSPYLAPVTSLPFVLGHETVGSIVEVGDGVRNRSIGDRVVIRPVLGCQVRGIEDVCDACRSGRDALCRNVTRGVISAGIQTGFCRDTGGALSESFIAHESQVFRVPEGVSDQAAVLVEPFACALHGALQVTLTKQDTALVIGCGAIGLLTIAALRLSGCEARIVAVAKHDHQRVLAKSLGATVLLDSRPSVAERYALWAKELGAEVLRPELGKPAVMGGATAVFDCVASSQSIDDGIRFTESGGTYLLVGMPGIPRGVDFTPLWFQELTVRSAYAYGPQDHPDGQRDTFELALDMMAEHGSKLAGLVGEPFALTDYREALGDALSTGRSGAVKTVIAPNG